MKRRSAGTLVLVLFLGLVVLAPGLLAQGAPAFSLKEAVEASEKALEAQGVSLDEYFLYSVVLTRGSSGEYWNCTYRPSGGGDKAGYGQVYVKVYMDAQVEVVIPEVPVRYR